MSSFVGDFICGTRNTLSQGFRSLPITIGSAIVLMGLLQGNLNFLFFAVGLLIVAPTVALVANGLWDFLFLDVLPGFSASLALDPVWFQVPAGTAEACNIFTSYPSSSVPSAMNTVPSFWMTMIAFFFSYIIYNASTLYNRQATSTADPKKVQARRAQAMTAMILAGVLGVVVSVMRYGTACETGLGIVVSWLLGYGVAKGWYDFMRACGMGRLDDLFGISNRILPEQSYEDQPPTVCTDVSS